MFFCCNLPAFLDHCDVERDLYIFLSEIWCPDRHHAWSGPVLQPLYYNGDFFAKIFWAPWDSETDYVRTLRRMARKQATLCLCIKALRGPFF